jgi:hypothetical protein
MMKALEIPCLTAYDQNSPVEELALHLNHMDRQSIGHMPWQDLQLKPAASFVITHGNDAVFLKYFIEEGTLRSTYVRPNDPVYNDSCVEFFIGFEGEEDYYNFEFNCAGTCLAGYGTGKERALLPANEILKIRHHSLIRTLTGKSLLHWELTLIIPLEVFIHHRLITLAQVKGRGNFFKCGDEMPEPHHLTWAPIRSPYPDFHLSRFFGDLHFLS